MLRASRARVPVEQYLSGWRKASRALSVLLLSTTASCPAAFAQTSFYRASVEEIAGAPGTLIRQEPMSGAPLDAKAYRVLYRSTGLKGEPIAVSGVVIIPRGPVPPEGRPIVAWAHPTTGIVPHCAPSLAHFFFQQVQGLREMVERGWIVAATDYPGLGTPGPHPYLVGVSEGRAVLDSCAPQKFWQAGKRENMSPSGATRRAAKRCSSRARSPAPTRLSLKLLGRPWQRRPRNSAR